MKSLQAIGAVIGLERLDEICGRYYKNGEKEERDSRKAQLAYPGLFLTVVAPIKP